LSTRYQQLAEKIIGDIKNGRLEVGHKLPSIRQFAKLYTVSINTVLSCFNSLQEQGWLESKPQSGFYITKPFGKNTTPDFPAFTSIVSQPQQVTQLKSAGRGPFYVSLIAPELVPFDQLSRCFKRASIRNEHLLHLYPEYQGLGALRKAISQHFTSQYFPIESNKVVITNGCIDAVRSAIEVSTKRGDAIAITSPCFNGLIELLANMGRMVVEIPFHQAQLDLQQLEHHMSEGSIQACLFSANHINPQGNCLTSAQKQRIAELASQYRTPIIEDDVYLELGYANFCPLPIKHWDKSGWVLWCNSISKTISPSYRLGWCEPGRYFNEYLKHRSVEYFGVNLAAQYTLTEFIYSGLYLKHLRKLRLKLSQHSREYHQLLMTHLPNNAKISMPKGGIVIWVQVPNLDSYKLFEEAKKHNIYFRPGFEFSTIDLYQDCFRINIGWPIQSQKIAKDSSYDKNQSMANQRYQEFLKLCELINLQVKSPINSSKISK